VKASCQIPSQHSSLVICRTLPYYMLVIEQRLCCCRRLESSESLLEKHVLAKAPDLEARLTLWDQKQVRSFICFVNQWHLGPEAGAQFYLFCQPVAFGTRSRCAGFLCLHGQGFVNQGFVNQWHLGSTFCTARQHNILKECMLRWHVRSAQS